MISIINDKKISQLKLVELLEGLGVKTSQPYLSRVKSGSIGHVRGEVYMALVDILSDLELD